MNITEMRITLPDSEELNGDESEALDICIDEQRAEAKAQIATRLQKSKDPPYWGQEWSYIGLACLNEAERYFIYVSTLTWKNSTFELKKERTNEVSLDEWLDKYNDIENGK